MSVTFETLLLAEERLVKAGFPPLSRWWQDTFEKVCSTRKRQNVFRVGRRGGKSSSLCRLAVAEALCGHHSIPPGDTGVYTIISANKDQAKDRLTTISAILDALGVEHQPKADRVVLPDQRIEFRVYAASLQAVVSMTSIGIICDEVARWRDKDTGRNPAREILKSVKPSMATMPNAKIYLASSPWSNLDLHYEEFERGDTQGQNVFWAPTWKTNPTLSESDCRELEEDEEAFQREYGAVPMGSDTTLFLPAELLKQACWPNRMLTASEVYAGGDFAFRRNSSTIVLARTFDPIIEVFFNRELKPTHSALSPKQTIKDFAGVMLDHATDNLMVDMHYVETVREELAEAELGIKFAPNDPVIPWLKTKHVLTSGNMRIALGQDKMVNQLKKAERIVTENGFRVSQPNEDGAHGDIASSCVLAVYQAAEALAQGASFNVPSIPRRSAGRSKNKDLGYMHDLSDEARGL